MRHIAFSFCVLALLHAGCGGSSDNPDGSDTQLDGAVSTDLGSDGPVTSTDDMTGGCVGNCTIGAKSCDGNGVRTCVASGTCSDWSAPVACGGTDVCSGGVCAATCTDQCTLGSSYCSGSGVRTCVTTVAGCTDWSPNVSPCQNGTVCSGGVCAASCTDRCAAGAKQCGNAPQMCEQKPTGCLDWGDPIPCASGLVCSGGTCGQSCTDQCAMGAAQCSGGDAVQTCEKKSSGCFEWSVALVCDSGTCSGGTCGTCVSGSKRCGSMGNVETCNAGVWTQTASCAFGCMTGMCATSQTCTAGMYRCNGNNVEICNASGTAYLFNQACAVSCGGGLCTGQCTPGQRRCNGKNVETCDAGGTTWGTTTACSLSCDGPSATCVLDKLEVTVDTDLNGVVVVDGPVTVTSPAKITSSSGDLTIRAKSINLGLGAQIVMAPTGTAIDGIPTGVCTQNTNDGSGGGYGTAGGSGACGNNAYIGKAFGYATDAIVSAGSPGGKGYYGCGVAGGNGSGGKGGGVLRLIASAITVAGQITANGDGGTNASVNQCGGGGGGSGGGILIAADQLDIQATATISANGGARGTQGVGGTYMGGNGGVGRIKLLYGSTHTIAGTSTPAASTGLLPPTTITSSTHPSQNLFYNDGFPSIGLSWNKAFPAVAGSWYRLNTSPASMPAADGQSTFLGNELVSLDPALVTNNVTADWFFHLSSIDATSVIGLIEAPFRIRVNATPPTITSSTHPTQTSWYTSGTAFFQWTHTAPIPAANDDANFKGFYYVLDHYGDTIPTKASTFLPITQKQINITNLLPAAGSTNGAADGVWGFHVISVDQAGYLTRNASHFTVRIASAPPTVSNIAGQVFQTDGTTTSALQGAAVTVNRKLLSQTKPVSDATGNYNFGGNIPVGTWEVSATKAGYMPASVMVTVGATTATANLTLTKIP